MKEYLVFLHYLLLIIFYSIIKKQYFLKCRTLFPFPLQVTKKPGYPLSAVTFLRVSGRMHEGCAKEGQKSRCRKSACRCRCGNRGVCVMLPSSRPPHAAWCELLLPGRDHVPNVISSIKRTASPIGYLTSPLLHPSCSSAPAPTALRASSAPRSAWRSRQHTGERGCGGPCWSACNMTWGRRDCLLNTGIAGRGPSAGYAGQCAMRRAGDRYCKSGTELARGPTAACAHDLHLH